MPFTRIAVDTREVASGIPDKLRKRGVYVQVRTLDVGDYVVGELAVERKRVHDFISSLYGGRLFEQAQRLSGSYKDYLLIVEGNIQEVLADLKNPKVYWGALSALAVSFGFKVLFTLDAEQTADLLQVLATKFRRRGVAAAPVLVNKPRKGTNREWQLSVVESLPTIGPRLAEKLLRSFGSVRKIFQASRVELAIKGGIGSSRASKIQQLLDSEYGGTTARQLKLAQ